MLQTQFWNTYTGLEDKGQVLPKDKWTIHGLWPDFCDGTYTQYCDLRSVPTFDLPFPLLSRIHLNRDGLLSSTRVKHESYWGGPLANKLTHSRQFDRAPVPNTTNGLPNGTVVPPWTGPSIASFVKAFGKLDLLAYMAKYWPSRGEPSSHLWEHEFSKHATCFSTFDKPCYGPKYQKHSEVCTYSTYFPNLALFAAMLSDIVRITDPRQVSLVNIESIPSMQQPRTFHILTSQIADC